MSRFRFIAMQRSWGAAERFEPRNNKLYDYAGIARNYSMREIQERIPSSGFPGSGGITTTKHDTGHVLIADLEALPRVTFDAKGKAVGLGSDTGPTPLEEYEEAERMVEWWANEAIRRRARLT